MEDLLAAKVVFLGYMIVDRRVDGAVAAADTGFISRSRITFTNLLQLSSGLPRDDRQLMRAPSNCG